MLNKIIISGSVFSGKQTLLHLLDGHPKIKVNTIHDKITNSLIYIKNLKEKKLSTNSIKNNEINILFNEKKNIRINDIILGESLEKSEVFERLKKYAQDKKIFNSYTHNTKSFYEFNFNFERFIKNFYRDILNDETKKDIKVEDLLDIYLINFFKEQLGVHHDELKNYNFAFKSPNDIASIEFTLKENFNCKIIYVDRDILGILKTRCINHINLRDKNYQKINTIFEQFINSEFVDNAKKHRNKIYRLRNIYPGKVYITSLEKLVHETENEINKVLNFLDVEKNNICYYPSYMGKKIGVEHIQKINDDEIEVSKNLSNFLYIRYYGLKYILNNFKIITLNIYIKFFIFTIKSPIKILIKLFSTKSLPNE